MSILLALLAAMQAPLPSDAPTVEDARRAIQEELRLARQQAPGLQVINVTSTTTPEAEHLATGARCRFWYRSADIDHPWFDDRAMSCWTAGGWVQTGLSIYDLRGPRREMNWGIAPLLRAGPVTLESLAGALTAASASTDATQPAGALERRRMRSPGGRDLEVLGFAVTGPGGAPDGTRQMRHNASRLLIVDGWIFHVSAGGPTHYRDAIEGYADAGVQRLIESLEAAARLPSFRAGR